jgi:membrane-bound metal-dependent hydrolase YbcI (DUF457 family)
MAAFREHVTFSSLLGLGYSALLKASGWESGKAILAGALCGLAGMLPDLDSDSGKPVKEVFGLLATVASLFAFHRLGHVDISPVDRILFAGGCYLFVRFGVSWLFSKLTVHRGMWHSIPAAIFVAQLTFLGSANLLGDTESLALAGGVFIGFISHLVLDEVYSVNLKGVVPRLKNSWGTALKLSSDSKMATITTWGALILVTHQSAVRLGYANPWLPDTAQARLTAETVLAKVRMK